MHRERHLLCVRAHSLNRQNRAAEKDVMVSECWGRWAITELRGSFTTRFNQSEFVPLLKEVVLLSVCPQPSFLPI